MDLRRFIFLKEVRKLPDFFIKWREDLIKEVDKKCIAHNKDMEDKKPDLHQGFLAIKNFPKTIMKLTRQMCSCNEYCVEHSMYYVKFDSNCPLYDLRNLLTDDGYYDSDLIDYKVIYSRFEKKDYFVDKDSLRSNIYNGIVDLCNNVEFSFKDLKCKAYELKDYCNKNITCYVDMLNYGNHMSYYDRLLSKDLCLNPNLRNNLESLRDTLQIPMLYKKSNRKREIRNDIKNETNLDLESEIDSIPVIFTIIVLILTFSTAITYYRKYPKFLILLILVFISTISCLILAL